MDDLKTFALRLLQFIQDSINEALSDRASRNGSLSEADGAIAVLKKTLLRDDQTRLTQLMLLGVFDHDLRSLGDSDDAALLEQLSDFRRKLDVAKMVF